MKIAVVTDDGKTVSQHFGRAQYYLVLSIEDNKVVDKELREKLGHRHFANQPHQEEPGVPHGTDPASHSRHSSMAETISDCDALICGGMGMGAFQSMQTLNIEPVVTNLVDIDAVIADFLSGKLVNHIERLH